MTTRSRRDALKTLGGTVVAALGACGLGAGPSVARAPRRIGVQLYSLGDLARGDLAGALRSLAAIGYASTELAGYLGRAPSDIRKAHDAAGLACASAHVQWDLGTPDEPGLGGDLGLLASQMHVLGVKDVVVPGFPPPAELGLTPEPSEGYGFYRRVSRALTTDHWKRRAALLNDRGERLRGEGLRVGFHNHSLEFAPLAGRNGMEILLAETDPQRVFFELDIGWVVAAGLNPIDLLRSHPGRFELLHVKDVRPSPPGAPLAMQSTEVGSGVVDWRAVLPAVDAAGVRGLFVEQEPPFDKPRLTALAESFTYLRGLLS
jgi:sugar phosphate isomerase/epimerase